MTSGERDDLSDTRKRDEANIRWLLAAVLHHEAPSADGHDEEE